jgi:hypothetical protein
MPSGRKRGRPDPAALPEESGRWEGREMPQEITRDLLEKIDAEFETAKTADDVRAVFKRYYTDLGWKRLCRLFVLQYGVDELWLAESERAKKGARDEP